MMVGLQEVVAEPERRRRPRKEVPTDTNVAPKCGEFVQYQVRRGTVIPMLVTAVHDENTIDGVAFSAWARDTSTSGTLPVKGAVRGDGDGEWLTSP